jgi:polysaccharide biosynthesis protein PelC
MIPPKRKIPWVFRRISILFIAFAFLWLNGCATSSPDVFRDSTMDFASIKTIAIFPLANFSKDQLAGERVRDVMANAIMANSDIYVIPPGEVARGIANAGVAIVSAPAPDELVRFCKATKADAVITGTLREYGDVRSGTAMADVISLGVQLVESQTGRIVWSTSTTQGGIDIWARLFGGGGKPLNVVTEKAVYDIISKLFD